MGKIGKALKGVASMFQLVSNLETVLGIPEFLRDIRKGAGWLVGIVTAALSELPWEWRLVLLVALATLTFWVFNAIYFFVYVERVARVKGMRRLLREAAAVASRPKPKPNDPTREFVVWVWSLGTVREFVLEAFTHGIVADYDHFIELQREKSKARDEDFDWHQAVIEYLDALAKRVGYADIDPAFDLPTSFKKYEKAKS